MLLGNTSYFQYYIIVYHDVVYNFCPSICLINIEGKEKFLETLQTQTTHSMDSDISNAITYTTTRGEGEQ